MEGREILLYISLMFNGDWDKIYNFIKTKQPLNIEDAKSVVKNFKGDYVTLIDNNYPSSLKNSRKPPFVLFYKGNYNLLLEDESRILSCIGSRKASTYGKDITSKIIKNLPNDIIIVSGLAKGIDGIAHKAAIDSNKKTIAVLGCGVNYVYPLENKDLYDEILKHEGLILSEYADMCEPKPDYFLYRNRIIACLSRLLLVSESYGKSGCNSTISFALQENKDICCVPFKAGENSNCNKLIKEGAYLVESEKDVLSLLQ